MYTVLVYTWPINDNAPHALAGRGVSSVSPSRNGAKLGACALGFDGAVHYKSLLLIYPPVKT